MYDASTAVQPLMAAIAAGGSVDANGAPRWKTLGTKGFKYADGAGTPDGLVAVALQRNTSGQAKIVIKGQGANLHPPTLPRQLPVTVQLKQSGTGPCWEGTYSSAGINSPTLFKGRSN